MTGLLPQKRVAATPIDLERVFNAPETADTVARVIKYLRPFYDRSNRSWDEINRKNTKTEEFCLLMPTKEAFTDEMRMVGAIEQHAAGKISDLEIKAVLDAFVESHTFVYFEGTREPKRGNMDAATWAECDLFYLQNGDFGFSCNRIQAHLIKRLHEDLEFKVVKL